jgi:hypothetical protein
MSYSMERIEKNFSNYSAFHHRSTYIKAALAEAGPSHSLPRQWPVPIVHDFP